VTTTSARSSGPSSGANAGTSSGAPPTWWWASTARLVWSIAASRGTGRPSPSGGWAPPSVLPSTATARRRPAPTGTGAPVPVGQPGADSNGERVWVQAGKGPADGGLGGDGEVAGDVAASAQRGPDGLRRIGSPFGDGGDRPGAGQHRGGGQAQDGDQPVAPATGRSRVGDGGEVGQQVRGFTVLEGVGVAEVGQGGWDRGCFVGRHGRPSGS
jgi:hypothetical protein